MTCLYDSFFYSTVCHVCKVRADGNEKLKRCGGCKMILYCGPQHQKEHWPHHKALCKCIQSITASNKWQHLLQEANKEPSEDWCKIRSNLMLLVQLKANCKLTQSEQQMFMFPRVCEVCREVEHEKLKECQSCYCVSYCTKRHQEQDLARHSISCSWLKLCFHIDIYFLQVSNPYPAFNVTVRNEYEDLPCDIDSFICANMKDSNDTSTWNQNIQMALLSEILTCPLTFLYVLEILKTAAKEKMVMHVVGAGAFECLFMQKWEIILHYLPKLTYLDIVFIGPEIEQNLQERCVLCVDCEKKGRNLRTHFQFGKLYHQYFVSNSFIKPDIIIAYNCGLHEYEGSQNDTWTESIPFLVKFEQTPLVLTSYTVSEAHKDIARIMDYRKDSVEIYLKSIKNPFGSKRPYRDWGSVNSEVFFQNNFLTVLAPNHRTVNVCS